MLTVAYGCAIDRVSQPHVPTHALLKLANADQRSNPAERALPDFLAVDPSKASCP
jgi:hypothetical protein